MGSWGRGGGGRLYHGAPFESRPTVLFCRFRRRRGASLPLSVGDAEEGDGLSSERQFHLEVELERRVRWEAHRALCVGGAVGGRGVGRVGRVGRV